MDSSTVDVGTPMPPSVRSAPPPPKPGSPDDFFANGPVEARLGLQSLGCRSRLTLTVAGCGLASRRSIQAEACQSSARPMEPARKIQRPPTSCSRT